MPLTRSPSSHTYITHPSHQRTHFILTPSTSTSHQPTSTILIQHGFARHSDFWHHWVSILSQHYNVIRRDLRGHGRSSYAQKGDTYEVTLEAVVEEVVDTLDQLGVEKCHFLGESTGGMVGVVVGARFPERFLSITLCSTPTHLPPEALKLFSFEYPDWPSACRELGSRGWAEELAKVPGTIPISDPEYLPWYLEQISLSDGEGLAQYAEFLSTLDARPYLGEIKVPTLVLAPKNSVATSVEEQRGMVEMIPGARLEIVDGVGHEIYVTAAEKCQELFLDFVKGVRR